MYLLDTNVVSELRRADQANANVRAWADAIPAGAVFLSAISVLELEMGVLLSERKDPSTGRILVVTRNVPDFAPTGVALLNPWGEA